MGPGSIRIERYSGDAKMSAEEFFSFLMAIQSRGSFIEMKEILIFSRKKVAFFQ